MKASGVGSRGNLHVVVALACVLGACGGTPPSAPTPFRSVPSERAAPPITVTGVGPDHLVEDDSTQTITVTGANLVRARKVSVTKPSGEAATLNDSSIISQSQKTLQVKVMLETAGQYAVAIIDDAGSTSNTFTFAVAAAAPPAVESISPSILTEGRDPQPVFVNGSGFRAGVTAVLTSPRGEQTVFQNADIQDRTATSFRVMAVLDRPGTFTLIAANAPGRTSKPYTFAVQQRSRPEEPAPVPQQPAPAPASCVNIIRAPAPVAAPAWIVLLKPSTDFKAALADLSSRYNFKPARVYETILGFSAIISEQALQGLRCEPVVRSIEQDRYGSPA